MRFFFHIRNKSAKCSVTLTWDGHWVGYEFLTVIRGRRIDKRPNVRFVPQFVSIDSVDMDSRICETYVADENEHWASMQDHNPPEIWESCKKCHEIIDDCYCNNTFVDHRNRDANADYLRYG